MQVTITISTDNAAFENGAGIECARILRGLAEDWQDRDLLPEADDRKLADIDGNTVGEVEVSNS